jgi:hypothetical protein
MAVTMRSSRVDPVRRLTAIRNTGSTSRILNLCTVFERHGDLEEYSQCPMFKNRRLNKAIIIKHTPRGPERDLVYAPLATKVILPFEPGDLRLGGTSFFAEQDLIPKLLVEQVSSYEDKKDLEHDRAVLHEISELPTLDPFLLRESLKAAGLEPARCYFEITDADLRMMEDFVTEEVATFVSLAFGRTSAGLEHQSRRLARKLLSDDNANAMEALRATLNLTGEEYKEGVFAWRGFLYYKWKMNGFMERLAPTLRHMVAARVVRATADELAYINSSRLRINELAGACVGRVERTLGDYDKAFQALVKHNRPTEFRLFLLDAPRRFLQLGQGVSALDHIQSYWSYKFPLAIPALLDVEMALDIFPDFEASLGGGDGR